MGSEAKTRARFGGKVSAGKALLETDVLLFRGDELRLAIDLKRVKSVEARGGALRLTLPEGVVVLELGAAAAKWALRIRNPKSLIDKLGVKADARVAVLGVTDPSFWAALRARAADVTEGSAKKSTDFVFLQADAPAALRRLRALRAALKPNGAIWVVHPKGGKQAPVRDVDVMAAAKAAGLVDVKVAGFSPTHSALKLVIPVAAR
ncbi:MAG TPA: DUF3052 family protein [Myxococcota bacterium]|jgi:hypothetical protein|nr:DUF3052 family protein [Myxococcota bacterium]